MRKHNGSCHCGEITYHLNSEIMKVVNCHCNFCRSHSGASFSTYAALPYDSLEITKGKNNLKSYHAKDAKKHFCNSCGTPIFNTNKKYRGACMIYLGTLEKAKDIVPVINVWCESKLSWVDNVSSVNSIEQGI